MKFSLLFNVFFLILFQTIVWSQEIIILDVLSNEPLEGVALFNSSKTIAILTAADGRADLSLFSKNEDINIQFFGYETYLLSYKEWSQKDQIKFYLNPQEQSLDEVILSIARNATTRKQIAEKVALISKEDIEIQRPASGADLIGLSPGVRIQKSQGGGGSPVLRGFEANRILLVVDGVRMNNAIYRSGHLQNAITVNPNIVERVEIVYGSSSVGYGSDALGGVIHYYTKSPRLNSEQKFKTQISSDYSTASNNFIHSLTAETSFKKWANITSFSYSDYGDIRIGKNRAHGYDDWGLTPNYSANSRTEYSPTPLINENPNIQKNTGYQQIDLFQKWLYQINDKNQFLLNTQYSTSSDISRYDMLVQERNGSLRFAEWYYGPQKRLLFAPQLKIFPEKKFLNSGIITAAYQHVEESRIDRSFNSLTRNINREKVWIWSLNADFQFNINEKNAISYGFEGIHNKVRSMGYKKDLIVDQNTIVGYTPILPIPTRYPSGGSSYNSFAVFLNWVWDVNEELTINAGSRITSTLLKARWKEYYNINALLSNVKHSAEALTATLAMTYRPTNKIQWNVIFSNGFRNPNIDDVGKIRESKGILIVPNPSLFPEYAYNFELGLTKYLNQPKNYFSLRGYTTLLSRHIGRGLYKIYADQSTDDERTILYNGVEVVTMANDNMGNRYLVGGSFEGKFELFEHINLHGNVSYIKSLKSEKYGPLPSISPIFGNLVIAYKKDNWYSQLRFQQSGKKNPKSYSEGGEDGLEETPLISKNPEQYAGTPAWNEFSWMAQYRWKENVRFRMALENIFDQHYRTFASGISAPGRNLSLGVFLDL